MPIVNHDRKRSVSRGRPAWQTAEAAAEAAEPDEDAEDGQLDFSDEDQLGLGLGLGVL